MKPAVLLGIAAAAALGLAAGGVGTAGEEKPEDPAVQRTRKQVRMLDDLYKGGSS